MKNEDINNIRVGNWFCSNNQPNGFSLQDQFSVMVCKRLLQEGINKPIKLDKYWCKIFDIPFAKKSFMIQGIEIKYVHQMQNFWYYLTGSELEIKYWPHFSEYGR